MRRLINIILGYLFPGIIAGIGGLISGGVGLAGLLGGAPNVPTSGTQPWWVQPGSGQLSNWLQGLNTLSGQTNNLYNTAAPAFGQSFNNQMGINYSPLINAGNEAGSAYSNLANTTVGAGQQLLGGENQLLQTSMDPQSALYARTLGQVTDQSNAINSMYGLGNSPVGAGITGQNVSNFNIDWQNQQLQRQLQGLGGAGTATGQALSALSGVPGELFSSGQLPIQGQQIAAQAPGQAASAYTSGITSALNPLSNSLGQFYQYLSGGGTGANTPVPQWNPYGAAGSAVGTGFNQFGNSGIGQQFGTWLSNLFGGGSGGGLIST